MTDDFVKGWSFYSSFFPKAITGIFFNRGDFWPSYAPGFLNTLPCRLFMCSEVGTRCNSGTDENAWSGSSPRRRQPG
ncbi:MAG: hypothetical protein JXJ04_23930 [Spirochaetales bacterium]|nr:hypothetical protein [Spirochaetales bacterium]